MRPIPAGTVNKAIQTVHTNASVRAIIDAVENDAWRNDARAVLDLMRRVTGTEPRMWGPASIGFGS